MSLKWKCPRVCLLRTAQSLLTGRTIDMGKAMGEYGVREDQAFR